MLINNKIWLAQGNAACCLLLNQANRHGFIAGASGTGKTVTSKVMAEGFSQAGIPVFMADVKGDMTGMAQAGELSDGLAKRFELFDLSADEFSFEGNPVRFWDMMADQGCPVRITISDMGPTMLARLLGLSDVQKGVLDIVFRIADDKQMLLIDLKDLRAMLSYVSEHKDEYSDLYGNIARQSVNAIQRSLISVEDQGGDIFFGEPNLELSDWFAHAPDGRGYINILSATKLVQTPQLYAMFLLWMMSSLFDTLPEVGDLDKPRFIFFFDEAHLLFNDMPKELRDKIVQVVKLIRSKGVGIYFITQSPNDIPNEVLAQLSNRVQHGLRAYTPAELKVLKAAAEGFRENPSFDSAQALEELATGEALVSLLDEDGKPSIVERAWVLPPRCRMAAADPDIIDDAIDDQIEINEKYGVAIDRESAYEIIQGESAASAERAALEAERLAFEKEKEAFERQRQKEAEAAAKAQAKQEERDARALERELERQRKEAERELERRQRALEREAQAAAKKAEQEAERRKRQQERTVSTIFNTIGREAARQITRGIFGGLKR
ncbi:MAG: DUF853 family protein [Atopobiaceae bacterium]|nr:DUF853 family protein [Atopobiaceae bacterium]